MVVGRHRKVNGIVPLGAKYRPPTKDRKADVRFRDREVGPRKFKKATDGATGNRAKQRK